MTGFPGQLTTHALTGCQTFVWQSTSFTKFYIKAFFTIQVRTSNVWKAILS